MRILIAPDKFKGSLTAAEAAAAIAEGALRVYPDAEAIQFPVADGGEGTLEAAVAAGYEERLNAVVGPILAPIGAAWAIRKDAFGGATAVIETAQASGLAHMEPTPGQRPARPQLRLRPADRRRPGRRCHGNRAGRGRFGHERRRQRRPPRAGPQAAGRRRQRGAAGRRLARRRRLRGRQRAGSAAVRGEVQDRRRRAEPAVRQRRRGARVRPAKGRRRGRSGTARRRPAQLGLGPARSHGPGRQRPRRRGGRRLPGVVPGLQHGRPGRRLRAGGRTHRACREARRWPTW